MEFKNNRIVSFLIVFMVYALATAVGVLTYVSLNLDMWLSLLIADIVATIVTFIFSLIFNNASVYDPYWSVQPMVILVAFALNADLSWIKILLLASIMLWGIRLTANWAYTFKNLNHQDWRYTMLKEKTGPLYPVVNFFGIHLVPTLVIYACVLPVVFVITNEVTGNIWSVLCILISIVAVLLQGISDIQMHKFRMMRSKTGEKFIRSGLWKHSRHPNYLGEILMWWGIALTAISVLGFRWYLLLGAILNTLLFLFISIPMADKRQSQKEGFEEYKKETRMLFPIKRFK